MSSSRNLAETALTRRFVSEVGWSRLLIVGMATCAAVVMLGAFVAPGRVWPNVLLAAIYFIGLALAGTLFLAFHYVTASGWSVCLKRVAEGVASTLPAAAGCIAFSFLGAKTLYEWTHADIVQTDPLLSGKAVWLNLPFFLVRSGLYLFIWWIFCRALVRVSRAQDATKDEAANRKCSAISAGFLAVFALTFTLASFDWLMSLEPHWYSTLYAGYNFAGAYVSGLAVITLVAILLRRQGSLAGIVTHHHLHDMGKLILGFSTFWIYLWFCQYMLIWYGNLPEEVTYYQWRHQGAWAVLSVANPLANWVIPFLVLLPRPAKHDESRLLRVCALLIVGRWLDLYLMVQPVFEKKAPVLGVWEIAPVLGATALFVFVLRRGLAAANLVPRGDPYLEESLHHHQ